MENNTPTVTENLIQENNTQVNTPIPNESQKITFKTRFLSFSPIHNRVNRSWFFLNIIAAWIIYSLLDGVIKWIGIGILSLVVSVFFIAIYVVQTKKRCHDFNNEWTAILVGIIIFSIVLFMWPQMYFTIVEGNIFWGIGFFIEYGMYLYILQLMPWIILSLIPWNPEDNKYGKSFWF